MEKEVKDAVYIALSLLVFSVFMGFAFFLFHWGSSLWTYQNRVNTFDQEMRSEQNLLFYNNTVVTQDDVLIAVKEYTQDYNISILPSSPDASGAIYLTPSSSLASWRTSVVAREMQGLEESDLSSGGSVDYRATLVRSRYGQNITGIVFTIQNS